MERYAIAEQIATIIHPNAVWSVFRGVWTGATDTLMVDLAGQLTASHLAPVLGTRVPSLSRAAA